MLLKQCLFMHLPFVDNEYDVQSKHGSIAIFWLLLA